MNVNDRERSTILAALRAYQAMLPGSNTFGAPTLDDFIAIAENDGRDIPLTPEEIDLLCERINFRGGN